MYFVRLMPLSIALACCLSSFLPAQESSKHNHQRRILSHPHGTLVVIPESRKTIAAYSAPKGTWARLKFESPLETGVKVDNRGNLVAVQTKDSVYAFNAATATWHRLNLPVDSKAQFELDLHMIRVTDGDTLYVLGVNDKAWSGISLESGDAITLEN